MQWITDNENRRMEFSLFSRCTGSIMYSMAWPRKTIYWNDCHFLGNIRKIQKSDIYNTFNWHARDVPLYQPGFCLVVGGFFCKIILNSTLCEYRGPIMLFHNPHTIYVALKRSLTQLFPPTLPQLTLFFFCISTPLLWQLYTGLVFGFCLMMLQKEQHSLLK